VITLVHALIMTDTTTCRSKSKLHTKFPSSREKKRNHQFGFCTISKTNASWGNDLYALKSEESESDWTEQLLIQKRKISSP
jgi:hypothetical protein